jgi:hypothetical protein
VPYGAGPEPVTIWAEDLGGSWKSGEVEAMVMAEELCPVVEFARHRIGPGDTVSVAIKGKKADGTIVDFRPERIFDLQITEGGEYGVVRMVEWDETGSSFEGVRQPFEFIAVDSLTVDSAVVQIMGYPSLSGGGGGERSIRDGGDSTHQTPSLKKVSSEKKVARRAALAQMLAANECEEPLGRVVVQQIAFPSCGEIPLPMISFSKGEDDDKYGCEIKNPLEPPFSYCTIDEASFVIKMRVCFDAFLKSPRSEPYILSAEGKYGICSTNVGRYQKRLLRIGQPVSPEDACIIKADLEYRLNSIVHNHGRSFPWFQTWVTEAELLIHEEAHWPQLQEYLRKALENESNRQSKTLLSREEGARLATNQEAMQEIADRAKKNILADIKEMAEDHHDYDEVDARLMQAETIKILIDQFAKSCH